MTTRTPLDLDRIVAQAVGTVDEHGVEHLSLRGLARDLGVTAPALYDHIRSKDDLLRLVAHEGYRELARRWDTLDQADALGWLHRSSAAYVEFALDRPGLFSVMFRYRPSFIAGPGEVEDPWATDLFQQALDVLERAAAGEGLTKDPLEMALGLWAAVHGVATVLSLSPEMGEARWLVDLVIDGLLAGWKDPAP